MNSFRLNLYNRKQFDKLCKNNKQVWQNSAFDMSKRCFYIKFDSIEQLTQFKLEYKVIDCDY